MKEKLDPIFHDSKFSILMVESSFINLCEIFDKNDLAFFVEQLSLSPRICNLPKSNLYTWLCHKWLLSLAFSIC